ncbi:MAG: RluA family pseudouridine synthase [Cephaloticoccus sp.]|nr:RluA family pseudouridine synthase [Cephaloticoccus sp.]MCF7760141.1 RluA family pseudouridine synthase [Cephaloticoccus sp.]
MQLPPIIYEDDSLLVFDKPSGMLVVAEQSGRAPETLTKLVRTIYGPEISNVHRLDAEASGLLLWAKTKPALDFLSGQFQAKTVKKLHHAVVVVLPAPPEPLAVPHVRDEGGAVPAVFSVDLWIGREVDAPGKMKAFKRHGGEPAQSDFVLSENFGRFALVECQPQSGRKHQLRVHLAAVGLPILNDALYGDPECRLLLSDIKRGYKGREEEKPMIRQLALHASELEIFHPVTRERLTLRAPLPPEFEIALKNLRKFSRGRSRPPLHPPRS